VLVVDWNTLAKQICKPNGRAIWPKFGKDVKFIMTEAKSGNFEILDNWNVKIKKPLSWILSPSQEKEATINEFILEEWDFELVFESGDSWALIEAGFWMVIAMDNNITEKLKIEWYARDLVRQIQEARKEANYQVNDRIQVSISPLSNSLPKGERIISDIISDFKEYIETETLSKITGSINNPDIEKEIELDDLKVNLKLKK
jgi:isoleucyl-tRNA synthetase